MAAFIIKGKITDVEDIKHFDSDGYSFNSAMSEGDKWVFTTRLDSDIDHFHKRAILNE